MKTKTSKKKLEREKLSSGKQANKNRDGPGSGHVKICHHLHVI